MEFEAVLKYIVMAVAIVGIPIGAYAAIVATRAIWIKGEPGQVGQGELQRLEERVAELESHVAHVAELEERLDFAERLLAQGQEERQVGPGRRG